MDTGLLTHIHNTLQMIVVFQRKGNSDLIQLVLRQDIKQVFYSPQHLNAFIEGSAGDTVIQNSSYHISPLRVGIDTVNVLLRCPRIPYQKNIFQVIALFTKIL